MIIDGHAHACCELASVQSTVRTLDRSGVDAAVVTPAGKTPAHGYPLPNLSRLFPRQDLVAWTNPVIGWLVALAKTTRQLAAGNEHVAQLARALPRRVIQCYWVQLAEAGWLERLEACHHAWRFRMLKLHQCWEPFTIGEGPFDQLARWGAARGLPLFVHARSGEEVVKLVAYAARHPQVILINAHLLGLEACLDRQPLPANLYFDSSGPQLVSAVRLQQAVDQLGAAKVLYGSDLPFGRDNQAINRQRIQSLPVSDRDKERILGGNLRDLLGF